MTAEIFITSFCLTTNFQIIKNGIAIYDEVETGKFLPDKAYSELNINYPKFHKMDKLSKLGVLTSELMFRNSDIHSRFSSEEIAVILCNSHSSIESDINYINSTNSIPSPSLFVYTLPNIALGEICIRNNFKGENAFFILDKFDTVFLKKYIDILFINKKTKACLCGWINVSNENYEAALFLIEEKKCELSQDNNFIFDSFNIKKIFKTHEIRVDN